MAPVRAGRYRAFPRITTSSTPTTPPTDLLLYKPLPIPCPQQDSPIQYPPTPGPWHWRCHSCGLISRMAVTRRCLNCGHKVCFKRDDRGRGPCKIGFDFDGWALRQAIFETLQNRGTAYERDSFDRVIALAGNKDIQVRWRQYLRRLKMTELPLEEVMVCIDRFLRPAWNAILSEGEFFMQWDCKTATWHGEKKPVL